MMSPLGKAGWRAGGTQHFCNFLRIYHDFKIKIINKKDIAWLYSSCSKTKIKKEVNPKSSQGVLAVRAGREEGSPTQSSTSPFLSALYN